MKRLVTPLVHDADEALPASVAQLLPPHGRTPYGLHASARLANASRALGIASRGYVMDSGLITMSGDAREMLKDPKVREAYLGE